MNHTIVKIKTRERDNKYRKLFSNQKLYELPEDLENTVEFIPDHNLDEECWFCVNRFSSQDYCIPLLKREFSSTSYELLEKANFLILSTYAILKKMFSSYKRFRQQIW